MRAVIALALVLLASNAAARPHRRCPLTHFWRASLHVCQTKHDSMGLYRPHRAKAAKLPAKGRSGPSKPPVIVCVTERRIQRQERRMMP